MPLSIWARGVGELAGIGADDADLDGFWALAPAGEHDRREQGGAGK